MTRSRQLARRERVEVTAEIAVWVGAPDDQVLRRLAWFRAGGEVSDRQWRDVVAILRVQGDRIDRVHLLVDAAEFGLADLATRAIQQAGTHRPPGCPSDGEP